MTNELNLDGLVIGQGHPVFVIAEISANHNGDLGKALELVRLAADAGADAIKIQTYTADTITLNSDKECFWINGTIWEGKRLYDLYAEAYTPWEWHEAIFKAAEECGVTAFSSPFDPTAVDYLEQFEPPCYKVASFEIVDTGLLEKIASTGRPIIMSTGMATLSEIDEAVKTLRDAGCRELALLKCTSAYPAPAREANLRTIPHLSRTFDVPAGLSDHTMGSSVAVAAVALGAAIIEKHFCATRSEKGPDSAFSMEPDEFAAMVKSIREVESALGSISYDLTDKEVVSRSHRRSLFVAEDIAKGETFTTKNIRSVRPANGLHPRYLKNIVGKAASGDLEMGTPLDWTHISN